MLLRNPDFTSVQRQVPPVLWGLKATWLTDKSIHLISASEIVEIRGDTRGFKGVVIGKLRGFLRAKGRILKLYNAIAGKTLQLPGSDESFFIGGCFYNSDEKLLFLSN